MVVKFTLEVMVHGSTEWKPIVNANQEIRVFSNENSGNNVDSLDIEEVITMIKLNFVGPLEGRGATIRIEFYGCQREVPTTIQTTVITTTEITTTTPQTTIAPTTTVKPTTTAATSTSASTVFGACYENLDELEAIKAILTSDGANAESTKLNATEPWSPTGNKPWVAVEFKTPVRLSSIKIQGDDKGNGVLAFVVKIQPVGETQAKYLKDGDDDIKFFSVQKIDDAADIIEVPVNSGDEAIQLVEIVIEAPKKSTSLRFALMGCAEAPTTTITTTITSTLSSVTPVCTEPLEMKCGCMKTCNDIGDDAYKCTTENCVEDCYCKEGFVLNNGQCIKEEECACYYNGKVLESKTRIRK
ncbi:uncharacterized protein [Amphiura filiformis]|uniref:uncharacterized protein n=1 Tax=Amphiura filiformis TaxID=82378 RepID=UPI003B21DE27